MLGHFLRQARSRRRMVDALVRQVAEASVEGVCRIAADRIVGMGSCEARGYLRGRAGAEIRRQARRALGRHAEADPSWLPFVVACAADRVGSLALRRLSTPTAHAGFKQLRAA